jgi:hypothetical protein
MENKYVMGFWVWVVIMMLILLASGCSTEYSKGWTYGIVTDDGIETAKIIWENKDVHVDNPIDVHEVCRKGHYIDPYTKLEYCLPDDFLDVPGRYSLKNYRVK